MCEEYGKQAASWSLSAISRLINLNYVFSFHHQDKRLQSISSGLMKHAQFSLSLPDACDFGIDASVSTAGL